MNDTYLAVRRLAQAVQILAQRSQGTIGTTDALTIVELCAEAIEAVMPE